MKLQSSVNQKGMVSYRVTVPSWYVKHAKLSKGDGLEPVLCDDGGIKFVPVEKNKEVISP